MNVVSADFLAAHGSLADNAIKRASKTLRADAGGYLGWCSSDIVLLLCNSVTLPLNVGQDRRDFDGFARCIA